MNADSTDFHRLKDDLVLTFPAIHVVNNRTSFFVVFLSRENPPNLRSSAFYSFRWLKCYFLAYLLAFENISHRSFFRVLRVFRGEYLRPTSKTPILLRCQCLRQSRGLPGSSYETIQD